MYIERKFSIAAIFFALSLLFAIGACDGDPANRGLHIDSGGSVTDGGADGASDADDQDPEDGAAEDADEPNDPEDGGPTDGDDQTGDTMADATDSGMDASGPCGGNFCSEGQICNDGTCECPNYHELCNGKCVAVNLNPDHCGSCGITCTGDEVCNVGSCVADCPIGMRECNGRCVDTDVNDDHCGGCGISCASDKACSFGSCVDAVPVDAGNKTCNGGGPPVGIEFPSQRTTKTCSGAVAKSTFRWGICSCDGINMKNNLYIDAFDSQLGPHEPGGYGGSLGSNGQLSIGKGEVFGSIWTSHTGNPAVDSTDPPPELRMHQQLHSGGNVAFGSGGLVGGDAWVDGDVTGTANFNQTLHVPQGATVDQFINTSNVVRQPVDVPTVCQRCKQDRRIPIEQLVQDHATNNDNSIINLDENALDQPGSRTVLKLPCGKYYLSKVDVSSELVITTTGRTALFIDGDLLSDQSIKILPTQQGELDVFVNGDVTLASNIQVGSTAYPASTRFYVNGQWTFQNDAVLGAYIYAIPGGISMMNNLVMYGGMYTQDLQTNNNIDVHYDRAILEAAKKCPTPGDDNDNDDGGGGNMDAGMDGGTVDDGGGVDDGGETTDDGGGTTDDGGTDSGPTCNMSGSTCSTDGDCCSGLICGTDGTCQTPCRNQGGSCGTDGDCCSPLVCAPDGTCQTDTCNNLYEPCTTNSDCCSTNCASSGICIGG